MVPLGRVKGIIVVAQTSVAQIQLRKKARRYSAKQGFRVRDAAQVKGFLLETFAVKSS